MADRVDILIVDDLPANLLAVEAILAQDAYRLVRATSGPDALRAILEHDFAVILIDVVMPGMDGFDVVDLVKKRERSRHTPIIFLTAAGTKLDFIYRGYSVGAVDYLLKPLDPDVLRAKVAIFAELFRKDRRIREQGEALRRNLAEAIPQIVWTAATDGAITYFNRRWCEYTGHAAGEDWKAAIAADDRVRWSEDWRAGIARGEVFELESRLVRRDGASRWHLCRAVPERLHGGELAGWLGTFTDCDDLKRAVDVRDEFLSTASHELRTPLTTLQLQLQSLAKDVAGPVDVRRRKVDACLRQSSRLVALVGSLFDFSRITSGTLTLHREAFDLADAARDVVDRLAALAAHAGITLHVDHAGDAIGSWDRLRIEQVIENLVGNAIKYAANGPVTVAIAADAKRARLAVTDCGPGIAKQDLSRIFSAFQRANAEGAYGGLGLGLYIARTYASAHGGTIAVTSVPGETTFTVELPRDPD